MDILLIEPFFSGSHRRWTEGLQTHSVHDIQILSLPGRHWKWRMHGAAISLSEQFRRLNKTFDLIITSDMLDVATFKGLCSDIIGSVPIVLYFHENQLTYPWSPNDEDVFLQRDRHYGFINYTSALVADRCLFNSNYHLDSFSEALTPFLRAFPDHQNLESIEKIKKKSALLPLGMDLSQLLEFARTDDDRNIPVLLWNHRWEYDKNPKEFFDLCMALKSRSVKFKLIVCGEKTNKYPEFFDQAKTTFKDELLHWGYAEDLKTYHKLLSKANVLPVTSFQDFFGGSVVEAIAAGCLPFLPNRLAYPEHIPAHLKSHCLYYHQEQLLDKLSSQSWQLSTAHIKDLRNHVSQYDWANIIGKYDQNFKAVCL